MIGHQHIGVQPAVVPIQCLPEIDEITMVVILGEEAGLAIVAALDHMLGNARQTEARFAGQEPILPKYFL
jgi:hypothetical protein